MRLTDNERTILLAMHAGARFTLQKGVTNYGCVTNLGNDRHQYNRCAYAGLRDKGLVNEPGDHITVEFTPLGREFAKAIARKLEIA